MKTTNSTFRLTVLSAALASAFGAALADDAEIAQYTKPDSSVSVGAGNWSNDRPQLGGMDGMRDKGSYGLLDADIVKRDDATGTWYMFKGQNLGLDTRELRLDIQRQGDIGGFLEYSKTPRDYPQTFFTGLQGIGTDNQTVSGAGVNAYPKRNVELGTSRDMLQGGFFKRLFPGLDFKINVKNEDKKGARPWGFYNASGQALFLTEPIDSTTRQLEAVLQYAGKSLQVSGGYYGSWYDNNTSGMVNAVTNGIPASRTFMSLPLDNKAHQAFVDGGYNFTPTTRGTFKVSYTRATQNEHLPTWDVLAPMPGAPSSLNGRVDTTLVQLGLSSRPLPKLSINASLRYHDLDDRTPVYQFTNVNGNRWNTPLSFTKTTGKVEGIYRLPSSFSLVAGLEYFKQDRSVPAYGTIIVPFRSELDELTYKLQLRRSFEENLSGSVAYLHSGRGGSTPAVTANANQNRYNPFHIADRKRDKLQAKLDWEPIEKLSLQFVLEGSQDDYGPNGNSFGLMDGKAFFSSVDASYMFNEDWKVTGWLARDSNYSRHMYATGAGNDTHLREIGNFAGLGVLGKVTPRLAFGADLEWQRTLSEFNQTAARSLPEVENRVTRLKLNGTYALEKNADIRLDFIHEHFRSDDWTWSFANGSPFCYTGVNNVCNNIDGTTVFVKPNQVSDFIAVRYIYKFQ